MKVKIKSFNGELPSFLTLGNEYRVCGRSCGALMIYDDCYDRVFITLDNCPVIGGGSWEIVE